MCLQWQPRLSVAAMNKLKTQLLLNIHLSHSRDASPTSTYFHDTNYCPTFPFQQSFDGVLIQGKHKNSWGQASQKYKIGEFGHNEPQIYRGWGGAVYHPAFKKIYTQLDSIPIIMSGVCICGHKGTEGSVVFLFSQVDTVSSLIRFVHLPLCWLPALPAAGPPWKGCGRSQG